MKVRSLSTRMVVVVALATSVATLGVAGPAAAVDRGDGPSAASKPGTGPQGKGPQARAAWCPPCAVVIIREAARRAAPLAAAGAKKLLGKSGSARDKVKAGASRTQRFVTKTRDVTRLGMVRIYLAMPRFAQGCARGLADHTRDLGDVSIVSAFFGCARGIIDIYRGKSPFEPFNS